MPKRLLQGGALGLAAAAACLLLWHAGVLEGFENTTWGWRVKRFARRTPPSPQVKVILLDQASLDWGKKQNAWAWPWPRTVYSAVLDFCVRGGAKVVAFDVLCTEPSSYGLEDDQTLGNAIRRTPAFIGPVVLSTKSGDATNWPASLPAPGHGWSGLDQWLGQSDSSRVVLPRAAFPIPEVATNSFLLANVSDDPDPDGQFRRASLFRVFDGKPIPSLGLAAFLAPARRAGQTQPVRLENGCLHVGNRKMPIDSRAGAILGFHGKNGFHETYSAAAVIQSELRLQAGEKPVLSPDVFKDAYVLFGFSAPGLLDLRPTPLTRVAPGTEIHATVLDDLLTAWFLRATPGPVVAVVTLLLGLLTGSAISLTRKAQQSVLVFVGFLPLPVLGAFVAYPFGWWWPLVVTEAAVLAALVAGVVLNYATEGR
jgi:adenylate cyclase